jgi:acyl dehydratase
MKARFLEDFRIGETVTTSPRTVSAEDVAAFAKSTGDHNPLHTDTEFAATGLFGRPVAHGLLGLAVAVGLVEETGVHDGTTIAMLDLREWVFRRPIHIGAQVWARMTVGDARRSTGDPARGLVVRHIALLDLEANVLQEGVMTLLVRARGR